MIDEPDLLRIRHHDEPTWAGADRCDREDLSCAGEHFGHNPLSLRFDDSELRQQGGRCDQEHLSNADVGVHAVGVDLERLPQIADEAGTRLVDH